MVAGAVGGFFFTLAGYPFDAIKTNHQLGRPLSLTLNRDVLRGAFFPLLFGSLGGIVYFSVMETNRRLVRKLASKPKDSAEISADFVAGIMTGLIFGTYSIFSEFVKVNMQADRTLFRNSLHFFRANLREKGLMFFLRGAQYTLLTEMVGSSVFVPSYFYLERKMPALVAGALAGCITWNAIFFFDAIKSKALFVYQSANTVGYGAGAFKGYWPGLWRAIASNAGSMTGYDLVLKALRGDGAH